MSNRSRQLHLVPAYLALFILCTAGPALAYVDPGTGSFVVQGIIATVVGASVALRMFWGRIRGLFGHKPAADDDDAGDG